MAKLWHYAAKLENLGGTRVAFTCPGGHRRVKDFSKGPMSKRIDAFGVQFYLGHWQMNGNRVTFSCPRCKEGKLRVLVCGDRNWTNREMIQHHLGVVRSEIAVVIEGEASGADTMAKEVALGLFLRVQGFPARWGTFGRAAGPIRNLAMLTEGKPDVVWAFHNELENSKGTKNMVTLARKAKVPVIVFKELP